ncbi:hypothetical protein SAMN05421840_1204 [Shewanella morhuae]|nr:hypothetical protein SAMN05421840_1204 [Shewanella morhuae]
MLFLDVDNTSTYSKLGSLSLVWDSFAFPGPLYTPHPSTQ